MGVDYYSIGTVSVTQGSTSVVGTGTDWDSTTIDATVRYFRLIGDNEPFYTVSSINGATLTLTVPFGGSTAAERSYMLVYEVTTNNYFPLIDEGTPNKEAFIRKSTAIISNKILELYGT